MKLNKNISITLLLTLVYIGAVSITTAEINYATIDETHGDEVFIQYRSPDLNKIDDGKRLYACNIDNQKCRKISDEDTRIIDEDKFIKTIAAVYPDTAITSSPNGKINAAIIPTPDNQSAVLFLRDGGTSNLYKLERLNPNNIEKLILGNNKKLTVFTNNQIMTIGSGGIIVRFDLPPASDYRSYQTSLNGRAAAVFSPNLEKLFVTDSENNQLHTIPVTNSSLPEFSPNGQYIMYIRRGNFGEINVAQLTNAGLEILNSSVNEAGVLADYLWSGNKLYYAGNTMRDPYEWNLYSYDPVTNGVKEIDEDFSRNDWMTRIGNKLAYLKVDEENTDLVVMDETGKQTIVRPQEINISNRQSIDREEVVIENQYYGVDLKQQSDSIPETYIIWLHGGPQRQTSLNYHPFFSYAIYDQILEKLVAEKGLGVLKFDYHGSYGYGQQFIQELYGNIGVKDIDSVDLAIDYLKDQGVENIFIMGNSHGGYLAMKSLSTLNESIDGAISINGVDDWIKLITRTGFPSTYFNGEPNLENISLYLQATTYSDVDKVDDPILLIHGANDETVPVSSSISFNNHLQKHGKQSKLVIIENEGHIFTFRNSLDRIYKEVQKFVNSN
jgi:dipeptidyl aminopeptidase/acylaminoacyl peptidase